MHFGRQHQRTSLNFLFKKYVKIYNLATLNPDLKTKKMSSPNVFLEIQFLIFGIFNTFYYILLESTIVYQSDSLKSLFHVEMNIRNSKIAVRILYENNFMPLHNKNVKINIWFYSRLKLLSVTHLFVTGSRHLFIKVPTVVS